MMTQAIELKLPAKVYERAEQIARESNRSLEEVLLEGLALLFGASEEAINLDDLPDYHDEQLWGLVYQPLAWPHESRLRELMNTGKSGQLDEQGKAELEGLIRLTDRITLLRSHALLLLKERGYDIESRFNLGR